MPENPSTTTAPAMLPLLSRGRHRNPSCGACFMEYTALLAGEPFSDRPECVDPTLAAILRSANDSLSDEDRPQLVPLLGQAIGLVVRADDGRGRTGGLRRRRAGRARHGDAVVLTGRLHALVAEKLRAAVVLPTSPEWSRRSRRHAGLSETFWDLMNEPARPRTAREFSTRLVERLQLLHRCYEEALAELGVGGTPMAEPSPAFAATEQVSMSTPDQ